MATKGFNLGLDYNAAPFIWGSLQDASGMQLVYQAGPMVVSNQAPGASYGYDSRLRLSTVSYTDQDSISYNYDAAGNRTSVVTTT